MQLVLCRVTAVKSQPVHHLSADNIFWSFGNMSCRKKSFVMLKDVASVTYFITGQSNSVLVYFLLSKENIAFMLQLCSGRKIFSSAIVQMIFSGSIGI